MYSSIACANLLIKSMYFLLNMYEVSVIFDLRLLHYDHAERGTPSIAKLNLKNKVEKKFS